MEVTAGGGGGGGGDTSPSRSEKMQKKPALNRVDMQVHLLDVTH